jgi:hypothetical protein
MNWDEIRNRVKKAAEKTADQINYSTDLATLQVKLSMAQSRLEKAYTHLGKTAYGHFTGEENAAEAVAEAMLRVEEEKKTVANWKRCIAALKKQREAEAKEKASAPKNQEKTAAEALPNESAAYEESTTSTQEEV